MFSKITQYFTGLTPASWLAISGGFVIAGLFLVCHMRGNRIDDLTQSVANERASHAITRASLDTVRGEIDRQNAAISEQRVQAETARADLARAVEASAGDAAVIDRLRQSADHVPAGRRCEPSAATKEIWK